MHALDSNLLSLSNGQLFDVPGRNENPYYEKHVFVASAALHTIRDSIALFYLDEKYFFTNITDSVLSIEIDFDDGLGARTVQFGDTIQVEYANNTEQIIKIEMVFADKTVTSVSSLKISGEEWDDYDYDVRDEITAALTYDGLPPASALYTINYAEGNTCIKKPFLLVEGIDFGYEELPTGCIDGKCGSLGWIDVSTGSDHNSITGEIKTPYGTGEFTYGPEFFADLSAEGYDVIYLDFNNGATYMQRNAFVVVEMINWIKENKCSDEELVIVGASMGGQLCRYALSYMEKNDLTHCTKLYISFDSPNQGANIVLGMQDFIKSFAEDNEEANDALNRKLRRNATRQLLLYQTDADAATRVDPERNYWLEDLEDVGSYPSKLRKVAIANGNKNAVEQDFSPEEKLINGEIDAVILDIYNVHIDADVYAMPGAEMGGFLFSKVYSSLFDVGDSEFTFPPSGPKNYDSAPGCYNGGLGDLQGVSIDVVLTPDGEEADFPETIILSYITSNYDRFCFIPTISALDVNTSDLLYNIDLNIGEEDPAPLLYPFEAYYAPISSEYHVTINVGNSNWTLGQLELVENDLTTVLPSTVLGTLENTYNFGNAYKRKLSSVNINSDGNLQINGNYITGFGNETYDVTPAVGSTFTTYTNGCGAIININSGGILEIGDDNTPTNNKGILELLDGSKVIVKNGGVLRIRKSSKLYIKEGAILELRSGSEVNVQDFGEIIVQAGGKLLMKAETLQLLDDNSKLTIEDGGTVETTTGVDFTFTGNGYINFKAGGIINIGEGGVFLLEGSAITDKVLSIGTGADLLIEDNDVEISDAQIDISPDGSFTSVGNTTTTTNVKFSDVGTSADFGLQCKENVLVTIKYTTFSGFDRGLLLRDIEISDITCPAEAVIEHCTFTQQRGVSIEVDNVSRINAYINTVTALDASVTNGVYALDVVEFKWNSGTVQGYSGAGIYLENVIAFRMHGRISKLNDKGIEAYNSNIFLRDVATLSENNYGIYIDGANSGVSNAETLCRLITGDITCAWIIDNEIAGIYGWDVALDLDAVNHANASSNPLDIHRNRFDGNGMAIQVCLENENTAIASAINDYYGAGLTMRENYWGTFGTPSEGTHYEINITEDVHGVCDDAISPVDAATSATSAPLTCACSYPLPCDEEVTDGDISARLVATSCDNLIPKQGNAQQTIMIAEQYRQAYMLFAEDDFNLSYQKFNYLKTAYESTYPQGINDAVCRYHYASAKQLKLIAADVAQAYCQYPFYPKEEMPDSSQNIFSIYPNPANNSISFSASGNDTFHYTIYSVAGEKVSKGMMQSTITLDIQAYPKGLYIVSFLNYENEIIGMRKFVLQ